jgi:hypothetical protein
LYLDYINAKKLPTSFEMLGIAKLRHPSVKIAQQLAKFLWNENWALDIFCAKSTKAHTD